jgi:glutaryl-CoA dehydrogenase
MPVHLLPAGHSAHQGPGGPDRRHTIAPYGYPVPRCHGPRLPVAGPAERDGDCWVLKGHKRWIGNGTIADIVIVWARDEAGHVGGFVVKHSDGAHHLPGYHARPSSGRPPTAEYGRPRSSLTACWCRSRFQLVQDKLSNMLADITSMQLLCVRMSELQEQGRCALEHAALAKLHTASAARRVCAQARDILGGNGILLDHHVARHHADIEAVYADEGTDTVQSLIVGRAVTGLSAFV